MLQTVRRYLLQTVRRYLLQTVRPCLLQTVRRYLSQTVAALLTVAGQRRRRTSRRGMDVGDRVRQAP